VHSLCYPHLKISPTERSESTRSESARTTSRTSVKQRLFLRCRKTREVRFAKQPLQNWQHHAVTPDLAGADGIKWRQRSQEDAFPPVSKREEFIDGLRAGVTHRPCVEGPITRSSPSQKGVLVDFPYTQKWMPQEPVSSSCWPSREHLRGSDIGLNCPDGFPHRRDTDAAARW